MFDELRDAVGRRMPNRKEDVELVQRWLQTWDKHFWPGSPGFSEGHLDGFTEMAIARFQRETMGHRLASGVVEPGDATAKKLASTPGPRPEGRVLSLPPRSDFNPLSDKDYQQAAKDLKCEARAIQALAHVESPHSGFDRQGRPQILFERRHFNKNTDYRFEKSNPELTLEIPKGYGTASLQWVRLEAAYKLRSKAALLSTSWGKFQIMGENYRDCKFSLLEVFISSMCASEKNHILAFVELIKADHRKLDSLRNKDWVSLAKVYNGPAYKTYNYDIQLKEAYENLSK